MPPEGLHRIAEGLRASLHPIDSGATEESAVSYDSDASAIFAAFTTPPTTTRKGQINTCVTALKTAGIWTKHDCIYMLAAADSQAATINWKSPGSFDLTIVNSPTFTADLGFTGASTKYLDSGFIPGTHGVNYLRDSASVHVWNRTETRVNSQSIIGLDDGSCDVTINPWNLSVNSAAITLNCVGVNALNVGGPAAGFFSLSRTGSANYTLSQNGALDGTQTTASVALGTTSSFKILSNGPLFCTRQIAYGAWGGGLTSTEITDHYNAINTYLVAVGAA